MAELQLIRFVGGLGNRNHDHVHRHNMLNLESRDADLLKTEDYSGGILPSTLAGVADRSGGYASRPTGFANIEDGWNIRRGIACLNFIVTNNSLTTSELAVMGYLTGGQYSREGIDPATMFVPVQSWITNTTNKVDQNGFPMTTSSVMDSQQILMSDPGHRTDLNTIRPFDMINSVVSRDAFNEDQSNGRTPMGGGQPGLPVNTDLNSNVVTSKSDNNNPANYAKALLTAACTTIGDNTPNPIANSLGSMFYDPSIAESYVLENPFFSIMRNASPGASLAGFNGWSIGEIANVFVNLPDVMSLEYMDNNIADSNNLLNASAFGGVSLHEIIATEIAIGVNNLMMTTGLTMNNFSCTNNIAGNATTLDNNEVGWVNGVARSVLVKDPGLINRTEKFKALFIRQFINKYNSPYEHKRTNISVEVHCRVFGETRVTIHFDDNEMQKQTKIFASYAINRFNPNVAYGEVALNSVNRFYDNVKEWFSK